MTTSKESALVLTWNEGFVETVVEEAAEGAIRTSINSRLSVLKGVPVKRPELEALDSVAANSVCGGIVPGVRDAMVAYFKPNIGSRRLSDSGASQIVASPFYSPQVNQNPYFPFQVDNAGVVFTASSVGSPATAHDAAGNLWFCTVTSRQATTTYLSVTVLSPDGSVLVPQQVLVSLSLAATYPTELFTWCGLTRYSGGMVVWYADDSGVSAIKYTLSGSTLTVAGNALICIPLTLASNISIADVVSDGNNFAWLLTRSPSSTQDAQVRRINLTTLTVADTVTLAVVLLSVSVNCKFALYYDQGTGPGTDRLFVATSDFTSGWRALSLTTPSSTMVSQWFNAGSAVTNGTDIAILPYQTNGISRVVVAVSVKAVAFTNADVTGTIIYSLNSATGVLDTSKTIPFYVLQGHGFCHRLSATEMYPYLQCLPNWSLGSAGSVTTALPYVADPSIEILALQLDSSEISIATVGRYGVDRVSLFSDAKNSRSASVFGGKVVLTYGESRVDQAYASFLSPDSRFVELNLEPNVQPSVARGDQGASIVAAAYPVVWDGTETVDLAQSHRPRVYVTTTGGSGAFFAGTFFVTAVISWMDAAGNIHRSSPALPVEVSLPGGTAPIVYVNRPVLLRDNGRQNDVVCTIYWTQDGGNTFYAQPKAQEYLSSSFFRFSTIDIPSTGELRLYSTGAENEPLLPEMPPAAWDVAIVAGRCWIIDAENRHRVLASKLKEDGISWEFNGALAFTVDPQYGRLVKIVDIDGNAVALAERGIWSIGGPGPDNSGQGQFFSDPQLISNIGCLRRDTVSQVPGIGILYQTNDGKFTLFGQGANKRFELVDTYDVTSPIVNLSENEIVYPLAEGGTFLVYNWLADGWTKWITDSSLITATSSRVLANGVSESFLYDKTNGAFRRIQSDSLAVTTDSAMLITRGWIAPELPQGDCVIREVWLQCLSNGRHGLSVTVYFDYNEDNFITRTWTAEEIESLVRDDRYTVGVNCHAKDARAVRVTVSEVLGAGSGEGDPAATGGMLPLNATVTYGASPGPRRRALRAGALK